MGWTAIARYSSREVYTGVAWESVYVAEAARGRGVGRALLETLIPASEAAGVWTLIAGVQVENVGSLALHERLGFRRVGVHEALGRDAAGQWRDVVILERRSASYDSFAARQARAGSRGLPHATWTGARGSR